MYFNTELILEWLQANKISLNTSKTQVTIFKPKQKQTTNHLNVRINEGKINTYSKVKYLGVILEERFDWNLHTNLVSVNLIGQFEYLLKYDTRYKNFF